MALIWIWFGCNICKNLIGKTSVEQPNFISCLYLHVAKLSGEIYIFGQNDDDNILFFEFPTDTQEDCHSLSYKEVVSQERRFRFSNGGEMLDSNVKKDSHVKSSL